MISDVCAFGDVTTAIIGWGHRRRRRRLPLLYLHSLSKFTESAILLLAKSSPTRDSLVIFCRLVSCFCHPIFLEADTGDSFVLVYTRGS